MKTKIRKTLAFVMSLVVLGAALWNVPVALADLTVLTYSTGGGVSVTGTNVWSGSNTFTDTLFLVVDDGDPTKKIAFQASGITTGTTRTLTVPNADTALAGLAVQQTFTSAQTVNSTLEVSNNQILRFGSGTLGTMSANTTQTPDAPLIATGTASNSYNIMENGDTGTDQQNGACGSAACVQPSVTWMSATAASPQTQYTTKAYFGEAGKATKTLTESSATSAFQYSIASGSGTGGTVDFTVFAADATDRQTLTGVLQFSGVNKAGTETCPTATLAGTALNAVSAGTLTCTYAQSTSPTNACDVQFNCVSSLTQTTLEIYYRVNLVGPGQVTPQ